MKSTGIDRRRLIAGLVALSGGTLLPSSLRVLDGALAAAPGNGDGVLTASQMAVVEIMADIIIPETDTPGAAMAGVPEFINHALAAVLTTEESKVLLGGLDAFMAKHPNFSKLGSTTRTALVEGLDQAMWDKSVFRGFYRPMKELVIIGYYTSEIGASQELAYDPVPGGYHEIKLTPGSRSWST